MMTDKFLTAELQIIKNHHHSTTFSTLAEHLSNALDNQNAKLNIASLQVIPLFVASIANLKETVALSCLKSFLLSCLGSIVEKLGDNKVKVSELSVTALIAVSEYLVNIQTTSLHGQQVHYLIAMIEKEMKTCAFVHKGAKARENVIPVNFILGMSI